jgi:hypothetical protein
LKSIYQSDANRTFGRSKGREVGLCGGYEN